MSGTEKLKIMIPMMGFGKNGGYRVLSELSNYWVEQNHDVEFVVNYQSDKPYYPTKAKIIWINNQGEKVEKNINKIIGKTLLKKIFGYREYISQHSKEYDVILANENLTTLFIPYTSNETNKFYYIQAYEPEFYNENTSIKNSIFKFIAWFSYFLPLKRVVNAEIYKKYKNIRSSDFVPPGLDLNNYYPKKLSGLTNKKITVGCIGRLEEWKGSKDVAEAVRLLHQKGYDVNLKVAFNPVPYEDHELVIPDGDEELADYYRSLDVLVAPGHIQLGAIHYPVIEAMACHVPVITTGYYPANNENSFIVPIKDSKRIAETIETIIENYEIAIMKADKALEDIKMFDWEKVSSRFIEIFSKSISEGK